MVLGFHYVSTGRMFPLCLKGCLVQTYIAFPSLHLQGYYVCFARIRDHKLQLLLFNATTFDSAGQQAHWHPCMSESLGKCLDGVLLKHVAIKLNRIQTQSSFTVHQLGLASFRRGEGKQNVAPGNF